MAAAKPDPTGADLSAADLAAKLEQSEGSLLLAREKITALEAENAALKSSLAAVPTAPIGENTWVLKTRLDHNGVAFAIGAALPFDPAKPPQGCDGLIEGVHYEKARVVFVKK